MRNPQGQATIVGPTALDDGTPIGPKGLRENNVADTFGCGHCQHIVHVEPLCDPANAGGLCKNCMRLICPVCVEKGICTPWEVMIERMEDKRRFRREVGI